MNPARSKRSESFMICLAGSAEDFGSKKNLTQRRQGRKANNEVLHAGPCTAFRTSFCALVFA